MDYDVSGKAYYPLLAVINGVCMGDCKLRFWNGDDGIVTENFSGEEDAKLAEVTTNATDNVYAWRIGDNLTPEQAGALLSRYSRTALTGRRLYLKEFLPNKARGREFFESWLVDYGDDSIQEMAGGIPLSAEYISNVAAKEVEDSRMASYIEKSTRYVFFDKKLPDGEYMFYKDKDIMESRYNDRYLSLMRSLFDSYVKNMEAMQKHISDSNPYESQHFRIGDKTVSPSDLKESSEEQYGITEQELKSAYANATKANALDFMRDYLPMSVLTHVGMSMNARSYENVIFKMQASPLKECNSIGNRMHAELMKIAPSLIKRVGERHGTEQVAFLREKFASAADAVGEIALPEVAHASEGVSLAYFTGRESKTPDTEAQTVLASAILYKFSEGLSMEQARQTVSDMGEEKRKKIIDAYVGKRTNRRNKPGRAFENVEYTFDFFGRIGIYRDLQRHRIGTQERQPFTTKMGYNMRGEFEDVGISDDYKSKMAEVKTLHDDLHASMPYQSQYVVTFGFNTRWYYKVNARQFFHFSELRTTPSGHPDYRKLVQDAYGKIKNVHPSIAAHMGFINLGDKKIGRLESEIRIVQKRKGIGK